MPQLAFTPEQWSNLSNTLNEYRIIEQKWEETTDNDNWDEGSALEEDMQSLATSVVDIMLHVRTQQFPEETPNATH